MGGFETFAINALRFSKKRGRAPIMNANKFYPRKEERELQDLTRKELERSWREALAVALRGTVDTIEEMGNMAQDLPEEFRQAIGKTGEKIVNGAQQNLAKFSEMTIGTPYYPPTMEESIKKDWEATFQQLCISAETDAKARIARLVNQGKTEGMNKLQVEKLVEKELPAETRHRAELISRTETAKLNNAATMATYRSAGIQYYRWLASIDDRTRPTHAAMNGKICAVGEPDTWYEENPDDPLHPIRHERDTTMYHGDPGTDYQCRCTSVPWDPRIDGKYDVKEAPEPEPKEPSKLEVSREETKKAEARAEKAEGELKETKEKVHALQNRMENTRNATLALQKVDPRGVKDAIKIVKQDVAENYSLPEKSLPANILNDFRKEFLGIAQLTGVGKFEDIRIHNKENEPAAFEEPNVFKINIPLFRQAFEKPSEFFKGNVTDAIKHRGVRALAVEDVNQVKKYIVAHEVGHKIFYESKLKGKHEKLRALYELSKKNGFAKKVSDYAMLEAEYNNFEEFFSEIFAMWAQKSLSLEQEAAAFILQVIE